MPKARLTVRPRKLTLHLPEPLVARLEAFLRPPGVLLMPQGAYQRFFVARCEEFFAEFDEIVKEIEDDAGTAAE